jgi:D-arabinose 1-dehydrogenase-like Zn-dependent alcohol dehydrogenase
MILYHEHFEDRCCLLPQGYYAILFADALGPEGYTFISSEHKFEDIKELGAPHCVVMNGDFAEELVFELDFIVNTRDMAEGFSWMEYVRWVLPHFIHMICTNGMLML